MPDQPMGPEDYEKQFAASGGGGPEDYEKEFANGGGKIPPPTPTTRPGAAWNSKAPWYENVQDQMEDVAGQVGRNVAGLGGMVADKAKDVWNLISHPITAYQHSTPFKEGYTHPENEGMSLSDLPVVGPAMDKHYGGAVGDALTGVLMKKAGDLIPGEVGGLRPGETAPFAPKSTLPKLLNIKTPEETNYLQASKPLAEIIDSPKGAGRFQDETLRNVMPIVNEEAGNYNDVGNIDSYDKLSGLVDKSIDKGNALYHRYLDPAVERGTEINRGVAGVPQAMIKAIPDNIRINEPGIYDELVKEAQAHGSAEKLGDLDGVRMANNATLRRFENMTGPDKGSVLRSQAATAMLKAEQRATTAEIYKKIDPDSSGVNVAESQKRLGSLMEARNGLNKLNDNMVRQNDPNFKQKMAKAAADALILKANPIEGATRLAIKHVMSEPDVNGKIAQAFSTYNKYTGNNLSAIPEPHPSVTGTTPGTSQELPRQVHRQLPAATTHMMGDADPSGGWVTTGAPLQESYPLELTSQDGGKTFTRQRKLFDEGIVNPSNPNDWRSQSQDLPVHQLLLNKTAKDLNLNPKQRQLFPEHKEGQTFERPYKPQRPAMQNQPLRVKKLPEDINN
jgi:hypothetical protein